ncbi:MAG: aldo/keto reductase [Chloroflexota bacterium]|nr:aldo/keto reductase [Chloroflexota bacterium]
MQYKELGGTGVQVSTIAFGCGPTAGMIVKGTPEERRRGVSRALDLGVNLFDTASIYGAGASETHLGETLQELKARPVIGSKVALELPDLDDVKGNTIQSVEDSLKRLQVETIDLIQLHNRVGLERAERSDMGVGAQLTVDDVLAPGGVLDAFHVLQQQGKVRYFGFTAYGGLLSCVYQLIDSGQFHSINGLYNIINPSAVRPAADVDRDFGQVFDRSAKLGMGIIVIRVLAAGLLAGAGADPAAERVREVLANHDTTPVEGAVRYVLSNPIVATSVIGFSEVEHIEEACAAEEKGPLPADVLAELEAVVPAA